MKKTLFIDCSMGAAGDMLCAALLELFDAPREVLNELNGLGIPHTVYEIENTEKCGIYGTKLCVKVAGQEESEGEHAPHTHFGLNDIVSVINGTNAPERVKEKALGVYRLLAEAESQVHRTQVEHIHFHELGTLDAVADILAFCYLIEKTGVERICASAVHVGKGTVHCAHGVLPVPAPATALLLKDIPIYSGSVQGELCTPTGAALLKTFVDTFGDMPQMRVQKIGYGMGTKDFETANCIRMFLGESEDTYETILQLHFNVDDMTAEEIAFGNSRTPLAIHVMIGVVALFLHDLCPIARLGAVVHHAVSRAVGIGGPLSLDEDVAAVGGIQLIVHPDIIAGIVNLRAVAIADIESAAG